MTKRKKYEDKEEQSVLRVLQNLVMIMAAGLGVTVAVGLRSIFAAEGGFTSWLVPIVFATVLTVIMGGLWHITLGMVARIDPANPRHTWMAIGFALALTAAHGATSIPFLASAIGGNEAVQHHQMLTVSKLEIATDTISARTAHHEAVINGFGREQDMLNTLLAQEVAGEGQSRQPGFGTLAREIEQAIAALGRATIQANVTSSDLHQELENIRAIIDHARSAANEGANEDFAELVAEARSIITSG